VWLKEVFCKNVPTKDSVVMEQNVLIGINFLFASAKLGSVSRRLVLETVDSRVVAVWKTAFPRMVA